MEFKVIIPNLDRRSDRWYTIVGTLLAQNYLDKSFARFSAHDAKDYDTYDSARAAALRKFPDSSYLRHNEMPEKYYFCWCWTWYEIMCNIARLDDQRALNMVLVDDYFIDLTYNHISEYIETLNSCAPIKMIQFAYSSQVSPNLLDVKVKTGTTVPNTPFRHGLTNTGDFANLVTPAAARDILEIADRWCRGVPNWVFHDVAYRLHDQRGYFSATENLIRPTNRNIHVSPFEDARNSF